MSHKTKYLIYAILDFGLTFGGTAGVIIYNYITPTNSFGFKLTFTGIVLVIALLLFAKSTFEKQYQNKINALLQQLASATDETVKSEINKKIEHHKTSNYIYQRLMALMPFVILYMVSWFGSQSLSSLQGTVGLILMSLGAGSVFNVLKKPEYEKLQLEKITKKVNKGR